jgi:hypothetical protein
VRVAGVALAVLLALVSSSWAALLAIGLGLAAFEVLVTLVTAPRRTPVIRRG